MTTLVSHHSELQSYFMLIVRYTLYQMKKYVQTMTKSFQTKLENQELHNCYCFWFNSHSYSYLLKLA